MQIHSTNEQEMISLNMLVYGDPGVGKTSFIGTAPKVLIADTESGLMSLRDQNVDYVHIKNWADIEELYKLLEKGDHGYETVAIDTLSELQKKLITELEGQGKFNNSMGGLSLPGWGEVAKKMRNMIRAFRDLPISVIFTAHAQFQSTDDESSQMRIPALSGKLAMEICGMVDMVGYMEVLGTEDGPKYVIRTSASTAHYAKDRTEASRGIMPPDFGQIHDAVFNGAVYGWTKRQEGDATDDENPEEEPTEEDQSEDSKPDDKPKKKAPKKKTAETKPEEVETGEWGEKLTAKLVQLAPDGEHSPEDTLKAILGEDAEMPTTPKQAQLLYNKVLIASKKTTKK